MLFDAADLHVVIVRVAHADAHVEPEIAVDQVVAAAAFDQVAAVAAEDDVARAERGHAGAEEFLQAVDERDVGEHAALALRR